LRKETTAMLECLFVLIPVILSKVTPISRGVAGLLGGEGFEVTQRLAGFLVRSWSSIALGSPVTARLAMASECRPTDR
jgi:hypothetical protein